MELLIYGLRQYPMGNLTLAGRELNNILNFGTLNDGGTLGGFDLVSTTGNGNPTRLGEFTLPGGTIKQIGNGIKITASFLFAANANQKNAWIYTEGLQVGIGFPTTSDQNNKSSILTWIIRYAGSLAGGTNDIWTYGLETILNSSDHQETGGTAISPQLIMDGFDFSIDNKLTVVGMDDGIMAGDITKTGFTVELF